MEVAVRILALEIEKPGVSPADFQPLLKAEAGHVWKLYQADFIREIYFRSDQNSAVLMLECNGVEEAIQELAKLPLVSANLIEFELIPLAPYPGFARLFAS